MIDSYEMPEELKKRPLTIAAFGLLVFTAIQSFGVAVLSLTFADDRYTSKAEAQDLRRDTAAAVEALEQRLEDKTDLLLQAIDAVGNEVRIRHEGERGHKD